MKTLQIDECNARKFYPSATPEFKQTLEDTFGKDFFNIDITERVKCITDAIILLPADDKDVAYYKEIALLKNPPPHILAELGLIVIIKALNEGWVPNWDEVDQGKFCPYFSMSPFLFAGISKVCGYSSSDGGSRHCLKNEKLARYVGTQFTAIYKLFLTTQK